MEKVYVPNLSDYDCVVVQNATTLRAYHDEPRNNSSSVYEDYYYNSHYYHTTGTQNWSNYSTLPVCLSSAELTDDIYYRNDLPDIMIIFFGFIIIGFLLPWKILTRMFKRWTL